MVERPPPPLPDLEPPVGEPAYAWFEGVLEGTRGNDDHPLQSAAGTIDGLRIGRADLELDGPRFSLLLTGATVLGRQVDDSAKKQFLGALEIVAACAGRERPIESTLRCTEVYQDRTVETLFGVEGGAVRAVGRVRAISTEDRRRDPRAEVVIPPAQLRDHRRRALIVGFLVLAIGVLVLWQQGWVDRLRSVDPAELPISAPEFGTRLTVSVERSFGNYVVTVGRGPDFPDSDEKLNLWRDRLSGARERMAHQTLAAGGDVYVHLLGRDSNRLRTVKIDISPLVLDVDDAVTGMLPGHPDTTGFALSSTEVWGR